MTSRILIGGGVAIVFAQLMFPIDPRGSSAARPGRGRRISRAPPRTRPRRSVPTRRTAVGVLSRSPLEDAVAPAGLVVAQPAAALGVASAREGYAAVTKALGAAAADGRPPTSSALRVLRVSGAVQPETPDAAREVAAPSSYGTPLPTQSVSAHPPEPRLSSLQFSAWMYSPAPGLRLPAT